MGTSNWQQIPFCIDVLMRAEPKRVLDIGVGFGRWGMIVREFCDVWYTRIFKDQWAVQLEGIEAFPRSITDYHQSFYNKIHIGDAADILPTLPGPWSVIIFGDVLEHFTKEKAHELLNIALDRSEYVLVNIPIGEEFEQGEAYGNSYERHLSSWEREDFLDFGLVRSAMFTDFMGRPYGSFVLSRKDPKDLRGGVFSRHAKYPQTLEELEVSQQARPAGPAPEADQLNAQFALILERMREQSHELSYIKQSGAYFWGQRLRRNGLIRGVKRALKGEPHRLTIRATGGKSAQASGAEVWLLGVSDRPGLTAIPWDFVDRSEGWHPRESAACAYGRCFMSVAGVAAAQTQPDPEVRLMSHPFGGIAEVEFEGRTERVDLYSPTADTVVIRPAQSPMRQPRPAVVAQTAQPAAAAPVVELKPAAPRSFTAADRAFIDRFRKAGATHAAVHCPRWLGVSSSTNVLFEHCYSVPATPEVAPSELTPEDIDRHARVLAEAGVEHVIFSGGDEKHLELARRLRELKPGVTTDLLWHGSYVQMSEDYVWRIITQWIAAVRDGSVRSILTVKAGMEEYFRAIGVPSALLLNYVPGEPQSPPQIEGPGVHVGMWISGAVNSRKNPHAMLAALSMMPGAVLHAAGLDARSRDVIECFGISTAGVSDRPLPREQLLRAIRGTHLSMYVTFSECCPMLPLESMSVGVPCLVGPVSHLFEDNAFLRDRLVVPSPDRADVIAQYAIRAVAEREAIMAEWARYAPMYNAAARESVARFMSEGPTIQRTATFTVAAMA